MDEYRGVSNIARKITKKYKGISGVARQILKEYRGIGGVERQYFQSLLYTFSQELIFQHGTVQVNDFFCGIKEDTVRLWIDARGLTSKQNPGASISLKLHGDLSGKKISFDYTTSNFNSASSTTEFSVYNISGTPSVRYLSSSSGHYSTTLASDTDYVSFNIWISGDCPEKSVELIISNLTIDGESVL